jgi:hypothetical protein
MIWQRQEGPRLSAIEMYLAFSVTGGLLLLWYFAGLLGGASHDKWLDFALYMVLFGAGPIAVRGAARRLTSQPPDGGLRMRWAVAAQAVLVVLLLAMLWLPAKLLAVLWYLPAVIHAAALVAFSATSNGIHRYLDAWRSAPDSIIRGLVPLLPALLLLSAIAYSPSMRDGFAALLASRSFLFGCLVGLLASGISLYLLRRSRQELRAAWNALFAVCAAVGLILLTNTRLNFDWIHYGTYIGAANAVIHGRFPLVDTQSQYGVLNYLLYSLAFFAAPHPTLTVAGGVSALMHVATYACLVALLWQLCRIGWFAALFGLVMVYAANHVAPFALSSFPAAFVCVAMVAIPAHRRFTTFSVVAYCLALLWSFEAAACAMAAYGAYLALRDDPGPVWFSSLPRLALLTLGIYGGFGLIALGATGSFPRFDHYLSLIFGFVSLSAYSGANWLKAIDPRELIWVPLAIFYFGVLAAAWRVLIDQEFAEAIRKNRLFLARITAVAACATVLLSLFVFRSLMVYLLIVAPLGLMLFVALTAKAWGSADSSTGARMALGLPFAMIIGLSAGLLGNIFMEKDGTKVVAHDASAAYDWARTRRLGFANAAQRIRKQESDYEVGMSFPWKPDRVREAIALVKRWFPRDERVLIFMPEAAAILLKTGKTHRLPTAYTISELGSARVSQHIATANLSLRAGDKMLVANYPNELDTLETRLVRRILAEWDAVPAEKRRFVTVYRLSAKSSAPAPERLALALPIDSAAASSQMSQLYSAMSAGDSWEASFWSTPAGKTSSRQWLQMDLGRERALTRIELVPYWPAADAFPSRFSVLLSSDGTAWTKIAEEQKFSPDWSNYSSRPVSGYRIDMGSVKARWIRLEAEVPFAASQGVYLLQIADILAFEN